MRSAPRGAIPTIKYAKDQTNTSAACAAIKTDTVAIITVIRNRAGFDLLPALTVRATHTSIVITNAWIAMLIALTPPPTKSCRNMSPLTDMLHRKANPLYSIDCPLYPRKSGHLQCTGRCPLATKSRLVQETGAADA